MTTKKVILLVIALLHTTWTKCFILNPKTFQNEAKQWVASYIWTEKDGLLIPEKDLLLIVNLCYFSFQRSYATLKAQESALTLFSTIWKGWENITHTRLDPSKNIPHEITEDQKQCLRSDFWTLHDNHIKKGQTYSHAVNAIVHSDALTTVKALNAVKKMRSDARGVMAEALVSVRKLLGHLFYTTTKKKPIPKKKLELLSFLCDYIPQVAMLSFSQADTLNNKISSDGWSVLHTVQDVGVKTWQAVEEARTSFYLAHYNALTKVFSQTKILPKILFGQSGQILDPDNQKTLEMPTFDF